MKKEISFECVEDIYKNRLCNSCGMCIGVCKFNAISYVYDEYGYLKPQIDKNKCVACGMCSKLCPGAHFFSTQDTSQKVDGVKYYVGYSENSKHRFESASGGITTEVLAYLLEEKIVDKCIVIGPVEDVWKVHPILTDEIEIVKKSKGSKYCPVPLGEIIPLLEKDKRYAIVGVPCQIQVLHNLFKNERERFILLSLFCNHCSSANATEFLLHNLNLKKTKCRIRYRGSGWPGNISIVAEGNRSYNIPFRSVYLKTFGKIFYNDRCRICNDPFGEFADISLADAFNCSARENGDGQTLFFIRNNNVLEHLIKMQINKKISMVEFTDYENILSYFPSQKKRTSNCKKIIECQKKFFPKKALPIGWEKVSSCESENMSSFAFIKYLIKKNIYKYISKNKFLWKTVFRLNKHHKEVNVR